MRELVEEQSAAIQELRVDQANLKVQLTEQKREIQILKDYIRNLQSVHSPNSPPSAGPPSALLLPPSLNGSNGSLVGLARTGGGNNSSDQQQEEIRAWVQTMRVARVTRWGGMISTPDAVLQVSALRGC